MPQGASLGLTERVAKSGNHADPTLKVEEAIGQIGEPHTSVWIGERHLATGAVVTE